MEDYYNKIKNCKIFKNIPRESEYTVLLKVLHPERLKYVLSNLVYLLAPLGYSFNVLYKEIKDIAKIRDNYSYINWIKSLELNSKLRFKLLGRPKKLLILDTDTWLQNDTIHSIVYNQESYRVNGKVFSITIQNLSNISEIQTKNIENPVVCSFSEAKPKIYYMDPQVILNNIEELGFISADGKVVLPKQNIQNDRAKPTIDFISAIKERTGYLNNDYFFTLFDGWREWTEPSDFKIFIRITERLLENFINFGSLGERGRFIKNKTSPVPDFIYPKMTHKILSYCKHKNDTDVVLIPDSDFLKTKGYTEQKKEIDSKNIPFSQKKDIVYWRGNDTGIGYKKYSECLQSQREICVNTEHKYLDAKFSVNTDKKDFLENKFLLDIDGEVNAWSGLFWKLYSGSVVLKVESHWEQWYYPLLKPWENYVPIKDDFSDFSEVVEKLLKEPELCLKISKNGRDLAKSLTYENVLKDYNL
jgi:hypothetical protein